MLISYQNKNFEQKTNDAAAAAVMVFFLMTDDDARNSDDGDLNVARRKH